MSIYDFVSLEVKETAFRLDGIAEPPSDRPDAPCGYVEVHVRPLFVAPLRRCVRLAFDLALGIFFTRDATIQHS
ncbi:MAG: DUF2887 domain-containing protein [Candidatus Methylumidiphilus sp.]